VALTGHDGQGKLIVADDGRGFVQTTVPHKGMGLHIMRYRAAVVGGTLSIRAGPAGGTVVSCVFPLVLSGRSTTNQRGTDAAKG
jgi:signal transduction histidine kinase